MGSIASHGNLAVVFVNGVYYASSPWYNPAERVHEEFFQEHLGGGNDWDVVGPSWAQGASLPGVIDGDRVDFQNLVSYVNSQPATSSAGVYDDRPAARPDQLRRLLHPQRLRRHGGLARQQLARRSRSRHQRRLALRGLGRRMGHGHLWPERQHQQLYSNRRRARTIPGWAVSAVPKLPKSTTGCAPARSFACSGPTASRSIFSMAAR